MRFRSSLTAFILALSFNAPFAKAQTSPESVTSILEQAVQPPAIVAYELGRYLSERIPKLPSPATPSAWKADAQRIRQHLLDHVVFHGWPRAWVEAPPKFKDLGEIPAGPGYRMRKLRYEIVPGFQSTAILYEPEKVSGKAPAILNVNGHVGPPGKSVEYKQKRCINFAKRGIYALNLEWLGYGELTHPENAHDFGAHLDLVGANELGLFYLATRRGLDYLDQHPQVDPSRLGVTGLSGGGWQTIVLGALDERVAVSVEVAGYGSLESNIARPIDTDEIEEDAADLVAGQDYTHLTAMRAPRPTLLVHNAEDDCCFRGPLVKPTIYDNIKPFFRLFGQEDALAWYENTDPATHNYQLNNREQAYRFFSKHFNMPLAEHEIPSDAEIKTYDELVVGLPKDNLTILGLAKKLAAEIARPPVPTDPGARSAWAASERTKLRGVVRLKAVSVKQAWRLANTKNKGLETISYRLDFSNGLSAVGVWLKAISSPESAPATIILNDKGKKAAGPETSERVNRGEQVLALDLLFTGDAAPDKPGSVPYALLIESVGDRPLGLEAAQLIASAEWLRGVSGNRPVRLEATGIRSQSIALVASALEPNLFSEEVTRSPMRSLLYLLNTPVPFRAAPDLFCLDLYKEFDLDRLAMLSEPAKVTMQTVELPSK